MFQTWRLICLPFSKAGFVKEANIFPILCISALATLKPQAGITAGSYAPAAPQPVSLKTGFRLQRV